jgi:DNA-binding CsgD family transcriptional regulator
MLQGLYLLFGVLQAAGGEGSWPQRDRPVVPLSAYTVTAEPAADDALHAYHRAGEFGSDPIWQGLGKLPGNPITRTRRQLVSDAVWYRSRSFEYHRLGGLDHALTSVYWVRDGGAMSAIALNRAIGDRDFTERERRLLEFFHAEVARLIGGPLVSATEPGIEQLSPRLRQTLACLLEGDSEKQVAARLGLSPATVHQYVTALYRHFGVQSRAQLVVHVLRRVPRAQLSGASEASRAGGSPAEALDPEAHATSGIAQASDPGCADAVDGGPFGGQPDGVERQARRLRFPPAPTRRLVQAAPTSSPATTPVGLARGARTP